jgi:hypothetical protein
VIELLNVLLEQRKTPLEDGVVRGSLPRRRIGGMMVRDVVEEVPENKLFAEAGETSHVLVRDWNVLAVEGRHEIPEGG